MCIGSGSTERLLWPPLPWAFGVLSSTSGEMLLEAPCGVCGERGSSRTSCGHCSPAGLAGQVCSNPTTPIPTGRQSRFSGLATQMGTTDPQQVAHGR